MKTARRDFLRTVGGAVLGGATVAAGAWPEPARADGQDVPPLSPDTLRAASRLALQVRGRIVVRGTPHYEAWRQSLIWNYRKFRRFPDVIVQAADEDDVVAAVRFAREQRLRITTRSGGHSWSGCFLRDGGVLVDVSRLQDIQVDVGRREVSVQPGVIGRLLNARLAQDGLAFPTAHCGMVPISGFVMGGGLGLNSVAWGGMSVFNIRAVDVVTAGGEKLRADAEHNSDYYWAARGAGPGLFFAVTRFHLTCYQLPRAITTDTYILPYDELVPLVAAMDELGPRIDPSVEMLTVVVPASAEQAAACGRTACRHVAVLAATAFADTPAEARSMLAPISRHPLLRKPLQLIAKRPTPLEVLYQDNEGPFPQRRARADNIYTDRVVDATRVLSRHMPNAPSLGNSPVVLWRDTKPYPTDAAYSARGRFYLAGYAQWDESVDDQRNLQWLKALYDDLAPYASGHYINEFDRETRATLTSQCFAPRDWSRLAELRARHDPDGTFHGFLGVDV